MSKKLEELLDEGWALCDNFYCISCSEETEHELTEQEVYKCTECEKLTTIDKEDGPYYCMSDKLNIQYLEE